MALRSHKELDVWQKAMKLVEEVYKITDQLPGEEKFSLTRQIRRAAVSVPANIAEGYGRFHRGDYIHHLSIAMGSLQELDTQIEIAVRLESIALADIRTALSLVEDVGKMLNRLVRSLTPGPYPRSPRS